MKRQKSRKKKVAVALRGSCALVLCLSVLATAGHTSDAKAEESWQFRLTPYLWFAGLNGDVGTIPPLPSVPIDISPSDALADTEVGAMVMFEGKKQRHGYMVDLLYTDVRSDTSPVPEIGLNMKSISKTTIASIAYLYEIYRQQQTVVDLLAGLRYWEIDSELRFSGGFGVLAGREIQNSESWVDPGVGIKAQAPLGGSRFYFAGGAVVGGLGVSSDLFVDLSANIGYQWTKSIGTTIGYRMFDVDYENDGYIYDVRQEGWQIGLAWAI